MNLLLGNNTNGASGVESGAITYIGKFQAIDNGTINQLAFYSMNSNTYQIKIALYDDLEDEPNNALYINNTYQDINLGWNFYNIDNIQISKDSYYWIGACSNSSNSFSCISLSSGITRYKYSGTNLPNPAGSGYTNGTRYLSFIAIGTVNLGSFIIGNETISTDHVTNSRFLLSKFASNNNAIIKYIGINTGHNGNLKYSIYSDNTGEPGTLLYSNNSNYNKIEFDGWYYFPVDNIQLENGVYYWIGINTDQAGVCNYISGTGYSTRYKSSTFSSFSFPDPAGSGFTSSTVSQLCIALYGDVIENYQIDAESGIFTFNGNSDLLFSNDIIMSVESDIFTFNGDVNLIQNASLEVKIYINGVLSNG